MSFIFKLNNLYLHIFSWGFTGITDNSAILIGLGTTIWVGFAIIDLFLSAEGWHVYIILIKSA